MVIIGANYRGTLHDDVTRFIHQPRENRVGDFYILRWVKMYADYAKKFFCYIVFVIDYN